MVTLPIEEENTVEKSSTETETSVNRDIDDNNQTKEEPTNAKLVVSDPDKKDEKDVIDESESTSTNSTEAVTKSSKENTKPDKSLQKQKSVYNYKRRF